jgi:hypothetical protein
MKIANKEMWSKWVENNRDPYSKAIIQYAERWANLMEAKFANGMTLETTAEETSHEADIEGITGFMYGVAVAVLASCWEHGERLRQWHNLKTQIGNEGEKANQEGDVLNPALLNIGSA